MQPFGGKFALVPLHLCDHSPRNISTLGLIGEIPIVNSRFSGEPFNGSQQHMCYFPLKRIIVWKSQGKASAFRCQMLEKFRFGESDICSIQQPDLRL